MQSWLPVLFLYLKGLFFLEISYGTMLSGKFKCFCDFKFCDIFRKWFRYWQKYYSYQNTTSIPGLRQLPIIYYRRFLRFLYKVTIMCRMEEGICCHCQGRWQALTIGHWQAIGHWGGGDALYNLRCPHPICFRASECWHLFISIFLYD